MTTKTQKITSIILLVFFAVSIFLTAFPIAFAEETDLSEIYTDVLDDLKLDPNFSTDKYRENITDVGFDLITISESDANELFLYLYQGGAYANLRTAKEVRISKTSTEESPRPKDYKLTLVSQNGVFLKYRVDGLNVESDRERHYQIIQIARDFIPNVDDSSSVNTGTTTNNFVYPINQNWKACTQDDGITLYGYTYLHTVAITDRYVGFIRYPESYYILGKECTDAHFIAFNTDLDMDKIIDAEVSWKGRMYFDYSPFDGSNVNYYPSENAYLESSRELSNIDTATTSTTDPWGKKYKWNRIQTVEDFIKEERDVLKSETIADMNDKSWVFRFVETDCVYDYTVFGNLERIQAIEISEITILRLHFLFNGVPYNLGVVCNKVTPDLIPDGEGTLLPEFSDLSKLLGLILGLGLVVVICIFFPWLPSLIWSGIKFVFKALWWIISFPFNLIGKVVTKNKRDKKNE